MWHSLDVQGLKAEPWLVSLDRATGRERWRAVLPAYSGGVIVDGSPAVAGDLIILATAGGHAWAVDRRTHQVAWHFRPATQHATTTQAEVFDGLVFHDGGDGYVYARRAADGAEVWRAASAQVTVDLLVTATRVYAIAGGTLQVLDRRTGRLVASVDEPPGSTLGAISSPAAFADGAVFVTVSNGAWSFTEP